MKTLARTLITALVLISIPVFAATDRTQLIRHKITIPEDGSLDEILELSNTWRTRILERADDIGQVRYLLREIEPDKRYELLVMYELIDPDDLPESAKGVQDLMVEEWGSMEKSQDFLREMWRYINPEDNEREVFVELDRPE